MIAIRKCKKCGANYDAEVGSDKSVLCPECRWKEDIERCREKKKSRGQVYIKRSKDGKRELVSDREDIELPSFGDIPETLLDKMAKEGF